MVGEIRRAPGALPVQRTSVLLEWSLGLLTLLATFFGAGVWHVSLCGFALFPYRLLLVALLVVFLLRMARGWRSWGLSKPASYFTLFFAGWVAYGGASMLWAADANVAALNLTLLGLGVLTALLVSVVLNKRPALVLVPYIWLLGVVCLVGVGVWERITGNHLAISGYHLTAYPFQLFRPTGFFSDPNTYATILALGFPFLVSIAMRARSMVMRGFSVLAATGVVWMVLSTGSRANILALGIEVAALLILVLRPFRKWRAALAVAALVLSFCLAFPEIVEQWLHLGPEVPEIVEPGLPPPESLEIRFELVKRGLGLLVKTYGAGVGPGGFEYAMRSVDDRDLGGIRDMHNWWAQVLVEYGAIVFTCYVVVYAGLLWLMLLGIRRTNDPPLRHTGEALFCSLVGFSLASISASSVLGLPVQWALIGLCIAFVAAAGSKGTDLCMS